MLNQISEIVRQAFKEVQASRAYHLKSSNQLVTEWDLAIEQFLIRELQTLLPSAGFITEEAQIAQNSSSEWVWVIDPIDGTTNFAHHLPMYSCSVALLYKGTPHMGVVFVPELNEMFAAEKGNGAFLNELPIQVSEASDLSRSLLATGFPYYQFEEMDAYLGCLRTFMEKTQGLRRMGSAAIDLAYTACGRFDGFFEYGLNMWDVAAGILLIEEAGGKCSGFHSGQNPLDGTRILASNHKIHTKMEAVIQTYFKG